MFFGKLKALSAVVFSAFITISAVNAVAQEAPSVGNEFIQAWDKKDKAGMESVVKGRADEVPAEVQAMVEYSMSPDASPQEQDFLFNIAGQMSKIYADQTGDDRLLAAVRANYEKLLETRKASELPADAVKKVKEELMELGKNQWKIVVFKMDPDSGLIIDIQVQDSAAGEGLTPTIDFKTSQKARDVVKKELPTVNKGKISWTSLGVGLKTVFLD